MTALVVGESEIAVMASFKLLREQGFRGMGKYSLFIAVAFFFLVVFVFLTILIAKPFAANAEKSPLKIAFLDIGGAAVVLAALEQGYFNEEGLEVQSLHLDFNSFSSQLGNNAIDGGAVDYRILAFAARFPGPKVTAGLYSGLLEIIAWKALNDIGNEGLHILRGQALGVSNLGSGPYVSAARLLRDAGLDPLSDVRWLEIGQTNGLEALRNGQVFALARWEQHRAWPEGAHSQAERPPSGNGRIDKHGSPNDHGHENNHKITGHSGGHSHSAAVDRDNSNIDLNPEAADLVQEKADENNLAVIYKGSSRLPQPPPGQESNPHAAHGSSQHFFQSFVALSPQVAIKDKGQAAAISRALIRGAKWVGENISDAAKSVQANNPGLGGYAEITAELGRYMWMPGVSHAKEHLMAYIREEKLQGILPEYLDETLFFDDLFFQALPDIN
jgi:ABC-type nitrate/sulfonate/bicarbonate transport system substrate-binding protein